MEDLLAVAALPNNRTRSSAMPLLRQTQDNTAMIRDGVDQRLSAIQNWTPIDDAPLGRRITVNRDYPDEFWAHPRRILGLTRDGRSVYAYYRADGDYVDRWTDRSGTVVYDLTHYRLPGKGGPPAT